ncbi:MAG: GWxTD domain-containing protein [Saprospiraceae bacterium]|nr:GWxTD domain-containing protein [Saprospiraceae bacterium]
MKSYIVLVYLLIYAVPTYAINADIQTYLFKSDTSSYVEIIYYIPTTKLKRNYKPNNPNLNSKEDSSFQFQVNIDIILKAEGKILRSEIYQLNSPFLYESKALLHQFRWTLPPGNYKLLSKLQDSFNPSDESSFTNLFQISSVKRDPQLSSVQLFREVKSSENEVSALNKYGLEYEPLPYLKIQRNQNILYSFCEVYSAINSKEKNFAIQYQILQKLDSGDNHLVLDWIKAVPNKEPSIILNRKDISTIPSGFYILKVFIIDRIGNKLDSSEAEFQRLNPFWDRYLELNFESKKDESVFKGLRSDSVSYYLKALNAILDNQERNIISSLLQEKDDVGRRMYLYRFFKDRFDTNCVDAFNRFQRNVFYADRNFPTGFGYGFESDRGVIFLKYGPPTDYLQENQDNGAYPYEIWTYAKMPNGQAEVKFLFYNPDLTETNYILLHSTCIGERSNKRWELELYRKVKEEFDGENQVEATRIKRSVNRKAREYFDE